MASRRPNGFDDLDDFNIEDYTSTVDFDHISPDEEDTPDSAGDTGRYTPVGHRGSDLDGQSGSEDDVAQTGKKGKKRKPKKKLPLGLRILRKLLFILIWLLLIVLAGYFLAKAGWGWANDLLALNKEPATAVIELDETIFTTETTVNDDGEENTVSRADMEVVSSELYDNGLIEYPWLFKLFATFTHKDTKLAPGSYELNTDMDYSALLRNMAPKAKPRPTVDVMIPEGYTLEQIIDLLVEQGVASREELEDAAANYDYDYDFLDKSTLGDPKRLEGFLFPDTYNFYVDDAASALGVMLRTFNNNLLNAKKIDQIKLSQAISDGYSIRDLVIIASIIEKETDGIDQRDISSVIFNRLTHSSSGTNGYLQMDSTVQYLLSERKDRLSQEDLAIDSPYNTYLYKGLPAGPICSPGLTALQAAVNPTNTDYFYFILGDDQVTHFFQDYDAFLEFRDAQTGVPIVVDDEDEYIEDILDDFGDYDDED
ncbi:MAG: endolytic transglycosylase MltG [Oscillospiraceae bacterium]|nr:endolytic transglycosylase MltG [Oscillospiraceae bacterium]